MIFQKRMPIVIMASNCIGCKRIISVAGTKMINPPVIGNIKTVGVTRTKVNSLLRGLKFAIKRLPFRREGEEKNNAYKTQLLQGLLHFIFKATTKW
jgi:hypothetical protein